LLTVALWSIFFVLFDVGSVMMIEVPGMITNLVWFNFRVSFIMSVFVLRKGAWKDLISGWLSSFSLPFMFMGCIMLIHVPSMVSLLIWLDP